MYEIYHLKFIDCFCIRLHLKKMHLIIRGESQKKYCILKPIGFSHMQQERIHQLFSHGYQLTIFTQLQLVYISQLTFRQCILLPTRGRLLLQPVSRLNTLLYYAIISKNELTSIQIRYFVQCQITKNACNLNKHVFLYEFRLQATFL